jgi:hypothetical protein
LADTERHLVDTDQRMRGIATDRDPGAHDEAVADAA